MHPLYPKRPSEFEVHAMLFNKLRAAGLNARGEVRLPPEEGCRGARFDIAVFSADASRLIAVVEVKKSDESRAVKQPARYAELVDAPIILCRGMQGMEAAFYEVVGLVQPHEVAA